MAWCGDCPLCESGAGGKTLPGKVSRNAPAPSDHTDTISEKMTVCLRNLCQLGGPPGSGRTDAQTRSEAQLACLVQRLTRYGHWKELILHEIIYPFG